MYKTILFIGTGQIGKAILNKIFEFEPKTIIIHNLTKKTSDTVCKKYAKKYPSIKFVPSYGNIFMPYKLKNVGNNDLYSVSDEIINYFYSEMTCELLEQSSIVTLIKKYNPELIIDAINSATVLGNSYNPELKRKRYEENSDICCKEMMVDDYTTKIINFVYSLKYGMEIYKVKKYIKVSTTGLGGMGINMPYTHGDNPKLQLSSALMGKISASGVLHQLLWNLEHTRGLDISLVIPGTFVGYDSVMSEPIETDKGLLKRRKYVSAIDIKYGDILHYNNHLSDDYLEFPVVRAGENHVYSQYELEVLTALGQMEAITKEEVANYVISNIKGQKSKDIFSSLNNAMLSPTYAGRDMVMEIENKFKNISTQKYGIATGNLGVTLSKQLYELYLLKLCCSTIAELRKIDINVIIEKINKLLTKELISEIISLGIPVLTDSNKLYIGDYSLVPSNNDDKVMSIENINKWCEIGWVDLRRDNLQNWCSKLIEVYEDALDKRKNCDYCIDKAIAQITDDYNIASYLAYYNNLTNKGRKK